MPNNALTQQHKFRVRYMLVGIVVPIVNNEFRHHVLDVVSGTDKETVRYVDSSDEGLLLPFSCDVTFTRCVRDKPWLLPHHRELVLNYSVEQLYGFQRKRTIVRVCFRVEMDRAIADAVKCPKGFSRARHQYSPSNQCVDSDCPVVERCLARDFPILRMSAEVISKCEQQVIQNALTQSACPSQGGIEAADNERVPNLRRKSVMECQNGKWFWAKIDKISSLRFCCCLPKFSNQRCFYRSADIMPLFLNLWLP